MSFDHFNWIGPIYDRIFGLKQDRSIITLVDENPHDLILDVGGGTGRAAALFDDLGRKVLVIDPAFKMLRVAASKGLKCVNASSENLPFAEGKVDSLIMVDALHHVSDQESSMKELFRLIKENGKIIIEEPDINHWVVKFIALAEKLLLMRSNFLSPEQIISRFEALGDVDPSVHRSKGVAWIIINKNFTQKDWSD